MNKHALKAYKLQTYRSEESDCKSAVLSLKVNYGGMVRSLEVGSIELDNYDIEYLCEKYKTSDLAMLEVEQELTIEKLNKLKNTINDLKNE